MPVRTPKERRQEATRQTILTQALHLIEQRGVAGWSLRELAQTVDYSPAGMYEYFPGKDAIVEALIQDGYTRFTDHMRAVDITLPTRDYLLALGRTYLEFARAHPTHFMLMFSYPGGSGSSLDVARPDESFMILLAGVQRAQDEGLLKPADPVHNAFVFWAYIHGIAMLGAAGSSTRGKPGLPDDDTALNVFLSHLLR